MTFIGGCFPTEQQVLLLKAALWQGEDCFGAWRKWISNVKIEDLDKGSSRILPQLYMNLQAQGVTHPVMNKLKGIYRHSWYQNQMLFHHLSGVIHALQDHGIKTLLLKGAAMNALYYMHFGSRPMADMDVLIPTDQAANAIRVVTQLGWRSALRFPERIIPVFHANQFTDACGREFDLHWHALYDCIGERDDDDFWDGAREVKIGKLSVYVLNPTDQLLHVCVHGVRWNPIPPLRWVADAMMILKSAVGEIDWHRLIQQTRKRKLTLPMKGALDFLSHEMHAPLPDYVLQCLSAIHISRLEHLDYRFRTSPPHTFDVFLTHLLDFQRVIGSPSFKNGILDFPNYMRYFWRVEHLWQLPFSAIFRFSRRVWMLNLARKDLAQ